MRNTGLTYWLCQIFGWGAYSVIGLTTTVMEHGWRPSIVYGYILFFLYSITLTHLLRAVIRRRNWTSLWLPRTLLRLVLASLAISAIQSTLVVAVYAAFESSLGFGVNPVPSPTCSSACR